MDRSIHFLLAKPVNSQYHEFGVNDTEKLKWISRDDLCHFITSNFPHDIISPGEARKLVNSYEPFIVDMDNKEFYELDLTFNKYEITNRVASMDLGKEEKSTFDKVMDRVKGFKLNLD